VETEDIRHEDAVVCCLCSYVHQKAKCHVTDEENDCELELVKRCSLKWGLVLFCVKKKIRILPHLICGLSTMLLVCMLQTFQREEWRLVTT